MIGYGELPYGLGPYGLAEAASGHAFDHNAFDHDAFDTDDGVVVKEVAAAVSALNESAAADGGYLVHKDLAEIRGKFIYRNAPPDQSVVIAVSGRGVTASAGEGRAVGEIRALAEGASAQVGSSGASAFVETFAVPRVASLAISAGISEASGFVDISDEDLIMLIGELI